MKWLNVGAPLLALLLMGAGCAAAADTPEAVEKKQEIDAKLQSVSAVNDALREQASLMVQIGTMGVDARKRDDWSARSKQAVKLMADKQTAQALQMIQAVNLEMRAVVEAGRN